MIMTRIALVLLLLPTVAGGQRAWLDPLPANAIGLELGSGAFQGSAGDFPTFTVAARARFPIDERVVMTLEMPFAVARVAGQADLDGSTGTAIGAPWVGIEYRSSPDLAVEVGIRYSPFDVDSEGELAAYVLGTVIDFDRYEAWSSKTGVLRGAVTLGSIPDRGTFVGGRAAVIGTANSSRGTLLAGYGARVGLASPGWLGWVGVLGSAVVNESGSFGERSTHQLEAMLSGRRGNLRPTVGLRRTIGEAYHADDLLVRLGLTWVR